MNKILFILLSIFITGAASKKDVVQNSDQDSNITAAIQEDMLVGSFERDELEQKPYSKWFNSGYETYKPNKRALKTIRENISDYEITLLMGTWCFDSQREIPKLYKILDKTGYDMSKLKAIAVDPNYSSLKIENEEEEMNFVRVPTIIFSKDGREVNRFVEFPQKTFEKDLAEIVSRESYKNPYAK